MGQVTWEVIREALVAAGGKTVTGASVVIERSNIVVTLSPSEIEGRACIRVLAMLHPVHACDPLRALLLAKDLELGSVVVAGDALALRHIVFASGCTFEALFDVIAVLAHNAALLAPAIVARRRLAVTEVAFAS